MQSILKNTSYLGHCIFWESYFLNALDYLYYILDLPNRLGEDLIAPSPMFVNVGDTKRELDG